MFWTDKCLRDNLFPGLSTYDLEGIIDDRDRHISLIELIEQEIKERMDQQLENEE